MTRRSFQYWLAIIAFVYGAFILVGIMLNGTDHYPVFKDILPLSTALPAAILAGIYQRRSSFLQQLRTTWSALINAFQDAVPFTHLETPKSDDFAKVMKSLSVVITNGASSNPGLR